MVWVRMAEALGIAPPTKNPLTDATYDLAMDVLVKSGDQELRTKAANIIRELSEKYRY